MPVRHRGFTLFAVLALAACSDARTTDPAADVLAPGGSASAWQGHQGRAALLAAVETWNDNITTFSRLAATSPPNESRIAAMANTAIHDVLNAADRRFEPYAFDERVTGPVSIEAAIATAAHDVLASIGAGLPSPAALNFINQSYATYMAGLQAGDGVTDGVQLGHDAAMAMLAMRTGDGSAMPPVSMFVSTGEPGKYRPTLAPSPDGLTGLQAIPGWGNVRPFVLLSGSQFRSEPLYGATSVQAAVATPQYLADYDEVKRLGGVVSERTQEQTEIAFFWIESSTQGWTRIARTLAAKRMLDAWALARLMSHVTMAIADGYIASFDSKYFYNFWRPVTAIRLGNMNSSTPGDPSWNAASVATSFGATPPIPEFNSGHAVGASAAAQAIRGNLPGSFPFAFESGSLPGTTRSFKSLEHAELENADSRVYAGFHFREATKVGIEQGRKVGQYVTDNALRRAKGR